MKVLVTGVSALLGQLVARELLRRGQEVIGLDRRPWLDAPTEMKFVHADVRKRAAEDVFRSEQPEALVHIATAVHRPYRPEDRYRIDLAGTRSVFEYCHRHGTKKAVFVGHHTYYGAAADAPLYHTEDEPPRAMHRFAELADLVAADLYAGSSLWRHPEIDTVVLRVCYTLGPTRRGTLGSYLRAPKVPRVMGFDPLVQFVHEDDAAFAIALALESPLRGVYNIAGPPPVPLSIVVRESGAESIVLPEPLLRLGAGRLGLIPLAQGAIDHLKYPIVIDDRRFREATRFAPRFDEVHTLRAFREASTGSLA